MAKSAQAKGGKNRKQGRQKRKNERRTKGNPLSKYVRGLITFDQYVKMQG